MAGLPLIGTAVGAASTVAGDIGGAIASQNQSRYEEGIYKQDSQLALKTGAANAEITRRQNEQQMGLLTASAGARGGQVSGSALNVLASEASNAEERRLMTLFTGQAQSRQDLLSAQAAGQRGQSALFGGLLGAAGAAGQGAYQGYKASTLLT